MATIEEVSPPASTNSAPNIAILRRDVEAMLAEAKRTNTGGWPMVGKALFLVSTWVAVYSALLIWGPSFGAWGILGVLALSFSTLTIQLAVMHDASHRSVTESKLGNYLFSMLLTLTGGTSILWYKQHVVNHHAHTNIPGKDPDLESGGAFRYHEHDPWKPWHRWQHLYAIPIYSIVAMRWCWVVDIQATITNSYKVSKSMFKWLVAELFLSRIVHVFLYLVLPYMVVGNIWVVLGCYCLLWMTFGIAMSLIFQCAHVTGVQDYPTTEQGRDRWLDHQLQTTANFSTKNSFLTYVVGGLNYQIEHHLFPGMSHLHYPLIQPVVQKLCKDHDLPYNEHPSFYAAVASHLGTLRRLSKKPVDVESPA